MENYRCYGMDAFRIMCCLGVLTYHTMQYAPSVFFWGGWQPSCIMVRPFAFPAFSYFQAICWDEGRP